MVAPPPAPCAAAAPGGGTVDPPLKTAASPLAVGVWTRDTAADGLPAVLFLPDMNTDAEEDEEEEEAEAEVTPVLKRCNIYNASSGRPPVPRASKSILGSEAIMEVEALSITE